MSKIGNETKNKRTSVVGECASKSFMFTIITIALLLFCLIIMLFSEGDIKKVLSIIIYSLCFVAALLIIFSTVCFIISKSKNKQINWVKLGVLSFLGAVICGAFTILWALLMIHLKGKIVLISLIVVYIFSILSSLCLIFAIACFIIAKVKWCKKIENSINLILENTNKQ